MTHQELIQKRGEITDKLTMLDNALCILISMHYFAEIRNDFIFDVLYERSVPVSGKQRMLANIFKRKGLDKKYLKDINRLLEIRNIFAHSWIVDCGDMPEGADCEAVDALQLRMDDQREHNVLILYDEFDQLFIKVQQYLFNIMQVNPNKQGLRTINSKCGWKVDV